MSAADVSESTTSRQAAIQPFVEALLSCCPMIRSIWLIGAPADGRAEAAAPHAWDLVAFADALTLHRLRKAAELHRRDVRLRVVTDGDRIESAWGEAGGEAGLLAWEWRQSAADEAYYNEGALGERRRCRAVCVWQS